MNDNRITQIVRHVFLMLALMSVLTLMACAPAATPTPKPAKPLNIAIVAEPDTLDMTTSRSSPVASLIGNNIFERLVDLSPQGEKVPGLAESWTVSPDGKVFDFTLRKGVKFQNGDPFTAKDVEFSHTRTITGVAGNLYARVMANLDKFEVVDDYHVRYTFKTPDVLLLTYRLPWIVSKTYFDKVGQDEFVKKPVGTGPYKFVEWKQGEYIDLQANDDYWGAKPSVKQVRVFFVREDTSRVAKLKAGEVDMITETPYALVKDLETTGFKTTKIPVRPGMVLQFHTLNPDTPWSKRQVRQAIAHALDGDSIVNTLFQGIPKRYAGLAPFELGYDPDLKLYPFDPAKAKQLLAEAGYPNGFEMPLVYQAGRLAGGKEILEAIALNLNAVGIKTTVQAIEAVQFIDKIRGLHTDKKGLYVGIGGASITHAADSILDVDAAYSSTSPLSLYSNPEFDPLIAKAKQTSNDAQRGELVKQAVKILRDDIAFVPIYANISVTATSKDIDYTPTVRTGDLALLLTNVKYVSTAK